jgi:isoamylase
VSRFTVRSRSASRIDLCLFDDASAARESRRVSFTKHPESDSDLWMADADNISPGQLYALASDLSDRFLLDPYARAIGREPGPFDPLGAVIDTAFDWQGDRAPDTAWRDTVIYEAHVKGFTALHPDVAPPLRGTFLGLASEPAIAHLKSLGVTAVELLPVHAHADEPALTARGLTNYWGYNTLSYFAPDPRFATVPAAVDCGAAVREFKTMVRALHAAGLEVILDVVYNHTAEGPLESSGGRTLSLRGLDPVHAYRRRSDDPSRYEDWTGCGNTLNLASPAVRALVLDSLRYWVAEMHVDGFRFDLASALDRQPNAAGSLFSDMRNDPILSKVKLIAEPWDATPDGYRLGAFPNGVAEWNGRYRDAARRFWRGDAGAAAEFATRLCGSQDLFGRAGRAPSDSINFVTSHDGFTLADLVSYADKHNEANGEQNRDGESNNFSGNNGAEGPTTDAAIVERRRARQRSLIASLFLSQGTPMLSGGDELGRSQLGNNNAYCQDNRTSWTAWPGDTDLAAFVGKLAALRRAHPQLRRTEFLTDGDIEWILPDGTPLDASHWTDPTLRAFGLRLDSLLICFNAGDSACEFTFPDQPAVVVAPGSLVVVTA